MKLSCAGYTFHTYFHEKGLLLRYLDICADMGLDGVELTQYYFPGNRYRLPQRTQAPHLKRGLELAGTAIGGAFVWPLLKSARKHIEFTKQWLEISLPARGPACCGCSPARPRRTIPKTRRSSGPSRGFRSAREKAAEVGVMIGVENHGGLTGTAEGVLRILQGVGSDWVGALLDFGNFSADPYREFEMIAPYAVMTHAKPTSNFAGTRGDVDFRRVKQIMDQAGYRGFLSIEYEEPGKDAMVEVPRFAAYLKGVAAVVSRPYALPLGVALLGCGDIGPHHARAVQKAQGVGARSRVWIRWRPPRRAWARSTASSTRPS